MNSSVSYTAASVNIPVKVLHDKDLLDSVVSAKHILLRHLQLCPTNRCNLNCQFCSCSDRDKSLELSLDQMIKLVDDAYECGCKAITVTGGGEPLLHPYINEIIDYCNNCGIKVGLVTNGLLLDKLKTLVDWCRVSFDSSRKFSELEPLLKKVVKNNPCTDWAFSFVLYGDMGDLHEVVRFSNDNNFTHTRVVSDINNPDDLLMLGAKRVLKDIDSKVIYQPRSYYSKGDKKCWISLLKPTIGADGKIYPCCGVQYAISEQKRDFIDQLSMGTDLKDISINQKVFDGSICDKCYYSGYNQLLGLLMQKVKHKEWV